MTALTTYETATVRLQIATDGSLDALLDKRSGRDYLGGVRHPLVSLTCDGEIRPATGAEADGDDLRIHFAPLAITAALRIRAATDWLIFELVGLSDETGVDEVTFVDLPVAIAAAERQVSPLAGCVRDEHLALACQTLDLETNSGVQQEEDAATLWARCYARFGLRGTRAAVIGCPAERFLDVVEALEIAEDLPHPTLDGVWARRSPAGRSNYFFIDLTEANVDEVIDIARRLGFEYILVYAPNWAVSRGSYEIHPENYPNGLAGFKAVADKIHAAGLKVGIHCLTGFVAKADPLVTPVPDPRLARDGQVTLEADLDAVDDFVPTVESPADFPDDIAFGLDRQGFDVLVDEEIISYRELSTTAPFGLRRCTRGARGTRPAPHAAGSTVWHLTQRFGNYLVDCDTDLADEVAQRYADVINGAGLDMIYFDGAGSNIAFGREWAWHYVCQTPLQSARLWKREVRMGGSCNGPLLWHLKAFRTCNDFVEIAVKRFFDYDKMRIAMPAIDDFVPIDFGWWGLHSWAPHRRSTTPDEIEYVCQKALAFGEAWSLETRMAQIEGCGRWPDIAALIETYTRVQRAGVIPEDICRQAQEMGAEFKLVGSDDAGWSLVPARYQAHLVRDADSATWTVDNDLPSQPLRFRLYALPELDGYEEAGNPLLVDQSDPAVYRKHRAHDDSRSQLQAGDTKTPAGEACVEFTASSDAAADGGWAEHRVDLAEVGSQQVVTAMIEGLFEDASEPGEWARSLGVWVHGDGSGAVLNVQLQAANGGYRDHYVDLDFTGWRYCELTRPETDRVYTFNAGYSTKHATRHFHYGQLMCLFLRYNTIPSGGQARCLVGPVRALREHWRPVVDPVFTVGGQTVTYGCQLETEQYLEFDGDGEATLFDREGVVVRRVAPQGTVPVLQPGANEIVFGAASGPEHSQRADVTVIRYGTP